MSVENSVCPLRWDYVCTRINNKQHTMCCHAPWYDVKQEDLDTKDYSTLVNSPTLRKIRLDMLQGKRPPECQICWNLEDNGVESFRQRMTKYDNTRMQYLIDHAHEATDINSPILYSDNPNWLEIHLGNTCDLKCTYCGPEWSSQWALEKLQKKQISESRYKKISINPSNEYSDMFWNYVENVGKHKATRIGFMGGEPLTSPEFPTILQKLVDIYKDTPKHSIRLWIVTNMNAPKKYFEQFMALIPELTDIFKLDIGISMESTADQAEYIRYGLNWERFESNVQRLYANTKDNENVFITFKATVSVLSVPCTKRFIEWMNTLEDIYHTTKIDFTMISNPPQQNPLILPNEFHTYIDDAISVLDPNSNGYDSLVKIRDSIKNNGSHSDRLRKLFYTWFKENDETRKTNLVETFPELKDFYIECSKL